MSTVLSWERAASRQRRGQNADDGRAFRPEREQTQDTLLLR